MSRGVYEEWGHDCKQETKEERGGVGVAKRVGKFRHIC